MKQEKQKRLKTLTVGKVKDVSIAEAIRLRREGKRDGAQGLPRKGQDGSWTSPFLSREQNRCEEFCSHMWAMLQLENQEKFALLNELTARIPLTRMQIAALRQELEPEMPDSPFPPRKRGEEELTEDQVRRRRMAERERSLAPRKAELARLEQQLQQDTESFLHLCTQLEQDGNTIRIYLHRVREHSRQRQDIYWNAAMSTHPEWEHMPPAADCPVSNRAEEAYWSLHRRLKENAKALKLIPGGEEAA